VLVAGSDGKGVTEMVENIARQMGTDVVPNIDELYKPTLDEISRQRFVSALRKHVLVDKASEMKESFETIVKPAMRKSDKEFPKDGLEVRNAMLTNNIFRVFSALRVNAQQMTWASVMDGVERALPQMTDLAREMASHNPAGGSVKTDCRFHVPEYVAGIDQHHIPGSFSAELGADDVAIGAIAAFGTKVFSGALPHRKGNPGAVATTVANFLKIAYPEFKPRRVLDLGTGTGKNLAPYLDVYPDIEGYGIDVAGPGLRYGHAQFEALGKPLFLSQQNAKNTGFPDGFFDLIVSSFFFHEVPVAITKQILKENYRLLAPGGRLAHMELPPNCEVDPYYAFHLDWDGYYNGEPDYTDYRAQVPRQLCADAGFPVKSCWHKFVPNWSTCQLDQFEKVVNGEMPAPEHGNGASWFIFGSEKPA
jgi:SAM-dependent methyltransferase